MLQLIAAAVNVADDVERTVLIPLVVPQGRPLDGRSLRLLGVVENEDVAEAFAFQAPERAPQLRPLLPYHVVAKAAILPVPVGDLGKPVTTGAFGLYAVVDTTDQDKLKAAHELAKWLTGSEVGKQVAGYQLAPGLRRSNVAYATTPERAVIAKMVEFGIYEVPLAIPAELQANYTAALQAAILGQKTAQQAMDDIAPEYQKVLDDLNKTQ